MGNLTRREEDFLAAIRAHFASHGCAPTREELRKALGWKSVNTVTLYLKNLVAKGRLQVVPRSARGIRIVDDSLTGARVPILRRMAPGGTPLSDDHVEYTIPAESVFALFRTRPDFFLRIQGESAAEIGLHDGDLVAVREASDARDGEWVVTYIDSQAATRVLRLNKGLITSSSGSPGGDAIQLANEQLDIRGVVIASLRSHRRS